MVHEGFNMKMNSRNRTFVRQVQIDLLTLDDTTLFSTVHQWAEGTEGIKPPPDVPEDTRYALGYTLDTTESPTPPQAANNPSEGEPVEHKQWKAPSPEHLRSLLTAMDVKQFAQHIIPLAFQALHPTYPEWHEGLVFSAHLANYLRQKSTHQHTISK
jgi:hypothetical protein